MKLIENINNKQIQNNLSLFEIQALLESFPYEVIAPFLSAQSTIGWWKAHPPLVQTRLESQILESQISCRGPQGSPTIIN